MALFSGCAGQSASNLTQNLSEAHRIIIDTDCAGDDALAMMMAAKSPNITIEGITVIAGNVSLQSAADNALMTLETAGCDASVYLGASTALDGIERSTFSVFGKDGMGDHDLIHPNGKPETTDAVSFMLDAVKNAPDEMEIVALGPVTNIAAAIERDPETMSHVKRIWSMGTVGLGQGNATPVAEFNVYKDAPAYQIMVDSGINITVVGLDLCESENALISSQQLERMKNGNAVQKFLALSFDKLLEFRRNTRDADNVDICDAIAMSHVIWSDMEESSLQCSASCITEDCDAYGEVIFYRTDVTYDSLPELGEPHVRLITGQNDADLSERIIALISQKVTSNA